MTSGTLGAARKSRGVFEGEDWDESLQKAQLTAVRWDEAFPWVVEHVSVQPLKGTYPFIEERYRIIQVSVPNRMIGFVYFRIEPDDENCTLLWIEARWFHRVG